MKQPRLLLFIIVAELFLVSPIFGQDSVVNYAMQEVALREATLASATGLVSGIAAERNEAYLGTAYEGGNLRHQQMPYKSQQYYFMTFGMKTLGRFKLYGDFSFIRQQDDSLGNTLAGHPDGFTPFYYFATKPGKYERYAYDGQATVAYNVYKKKIYFSNNLQYVQHRTTRSVDPRPDVHTFKIAWTPELTFRWQNHYLGVQGYLGKGNEKVETTYKNTSYQHSLLFEDRILYNNYGYGLLSIRDSSSHIRYSYEQGVGGSYYYKSDRWQWGIHGKYSYLFDELTYNVLRNKDYHITSGWEVNTWTGGGLLQWQQANLSHLLTVHYLRKDGKDWNAVFNARNYFARQQQLGFYYAALLQRVHGNNQWLLGGGLDYFYLYKLDHASTHELFVTNLAPYLRTAYHWLNRPKHQFRLELEGKWIQPLEYDLAVATNQINLFIEHVAVPEYLYFATAFWSAGLNIAYDIAMARNKNRLGLKLGGFIQQRAGPLHVYKGFESSSLMLNSKRWHTYASLYLFL